MIKAIIFDLAGVIISDGYWSWLNEFVADIEKKKEFFLKQGDLVDSNEITVEEHEKAMAEAASVEWKTVWPEVKKRLVIDWEMITLISKLKRQYKIGALSNFPKEWFEEIFTENKLQNYFDTLVISSINHVIKPQKEAYQIVLNLLEVEPQEAIFIDDREKNIQGAKVIGIDSILFKNQQQLISDLQKKGVKITN